MKNDVLSKRVSIPLRYGNKKMTKDQVVVVKHIRVNSS